MCQQFIKTKRGKRYLADLCFPSLKLYYEIDEAHHKSYQNKAKDEDRQKEIIDATDFEEHRIKVFDKNIREIDSKVDEFVAFKNKLFTNPLSNEKYSNIKTMNKIKLV